MLKNDHDVDFPKEMRASGGGDKGGVWKMGKNLRTSFIDGPNIIKFNNYSNTIDNTMSTEYAALLYCDF